MLVSQIKQKSNIKRKIKEDNLKSKESKPIKKRKKNILYLCILLILHLKIIILTYN